MKSMRMVVDASCVCLRSCASVDTHVSSLPIINLYCELSIRNGHEPVNPHQSKIRASTEVSRKLAP